VNFFLLFSQTISLSLIPFVLSIYVLKKISTLDPMAQRQKIIVRRCGETRVIVARVDGKRAERAHFPASGWGQKRFRRSTKQQRESGPKNDESAIRAVRHAWKATRASAPWNVRAKEISSATAGVTL